MTKLILIRHGLSQGNKEKRFSGQMDFPLDPIGLSQAKEMAHYVLDHFTVDRIYSSDLCRAMDTVKPVAEALGLEVIPCKGLREVDVGLLQGKLITVVEKEFPDTFRVYRENPGLSRFDGGESYAELMRRAVRAVEEIVGENEGKTVLIGTHGGVIRTLRAAWTNTPLEKIRDIPHVPNCSVTVVHYEPGHPELALVGYNDYLAEKTTEEGVK